MIRRDSAMADKKNAEKRSEEHTSELQSRPHLVCRLLLEKKKKKKKKTTTLKKKKKTKNTNYAAHSYKRVTPSPQPSPAVRQSYRTTNSSQLNGILYCPSV